MNTFRSKSYNFYGLTRNQEINKIFNILKFYKKSMRSNTLFVAENNRNFYITNCEEFLPSKISNLKLRTLDNSNIIR